MPRVLLSLARWNIETRKQTVGDATMRRPISQKPTRPNRAVYFWGRHTYTQLVGRLLLYCLVIWFEIGRNTTLEGVIRLWFICLQAAGLSNNEKPK